jgi:hypothetical protein
MDRKVIAREWLLFIGLLALGLILIPPVLEVLLPGQRRVSDFYAGLFSRQEWGITWLIVLGPHLVVQLLRSVVWAIRVLFYCCNEKR